LELQNRKLATENEGLVERVAALEHKVKLLQMEKEQMAEKLEDGKKEKAELERHQDDLEKDMKFLECEIEDLRI
jgi:cell division protein FtsB